MTADGALFKTKTGLFIDQKQLTDKCLAIAGFSSPLPKGYKMYYFTLPSTGEMVIEIYQTEEEIG